MENLVVTLATAKKLKAAGFPQDSVYHWFYTRTLQTTSWNWHLVFDQYKDLDEGERLLAAATAQELADQLPSGIHAFKKIGGQWEVSTMLNSKSYHEINTLCEALAHLWLILQEAK